MKRSVLFVLMLVLLCLLTSAAFAQDKAQWTVMMYLCGTDLESENGFGAASYNLAEVTKTKANDSVNFVVQTGGTKLWNSESKLGFLISSEVMERRIYTENGFELVGSVPSASMGDPDVLADFLSWAAANYPAEKYAVILWDHGGGPIYGIFSDELYNKARLNIPQVAQAFESSGLHFETIIYDACLMGNLEVALQMAPYGNYLIASEETVPGFGTNYATWLQYLYDRPDCDGARFGRNFCDAIQQQYAEFGKRSNSDTLTFAVIDLKKVQPVADAFEDLISEAGALLPDPVNYYPYAYFTRRTEGYGKSNAFNLYDLGDLAEKSKGSGIKLETANALEDAVEDAVLYQIKGSGHSYSHGLSFFYGQNAELKELDMYAEAGILPRYLAFLDTVREDWNAPDWVYEQVERPEPIAEGAYDVKTRVSISDDASHAVLDITNAKDAVLAVDYQLSYFNADDRQFLLFGRSHEVEGDFNEGRFFDHFTGKWTTVGDHYCDLQIVDESDTTVVYNIPFVDANDEDQTMMYLRAGFVYDNDYAEDMYGQFEGYYEVYGAWEGYDSNTGLASRNVIDVNYLVGSEIRNLLPIIDPKTSNTVDYFKTDPYVIDSDFGIGLADLPYGMYGLNFIVFDVFNYRYTTPMLLFEYNENGVQYYDPEAAQEFIRQLAASKAGNHKLN